MEEGIKKGNTFQTAASQPHGGISLYRDILSNVLDETSAKTKPQQPNNAVSGDSSLSADYENGITSAEPNGKPTVSYSKGNIKNRNEQGKSEKVSASERPNDVQVAVATAEAETNVEPTEAQKETQTLTHDDAISLIAQMEDRADVAPEIELTIENWDAQFGEDGRGSNGSLAGREPGDLAKTEKINYQLSDEVDENGHQFVLNSDGNIEFGRIGSDTGLTPAPILLSEGIITNPNTNAGYGLLHIEARHGDQIRAAGYDSVLEFIEEVAKNYEVIRKGNDRDGIATYMLQLTDEHNNTLMVELSGDGTYWNINTAGIFKTSYGANRTVVYARHTTDNQPAETDGASLSGEQSGTTPLTRMNAPAQSYQNGALDNTTDTGKTHIGNGNDTATPENTAILFGKGSDNSVSKQENSEKLAANEQANEVQVAVETAEAETNVEPTEAQKETQTLTHDDAISLIAQIEDRADVAPEIELTIENWDAQFGEDGRVVTPIGEVKMGENQFAKLMRQGRDGKLGMIKPTLENPDVIIEDASEAKDGDKAERNSSYIFVKAFKKADGSRYYYFASNTVSEDGREVVVSNQEKSRNRLLRLMTEGKVLWHTPKDATTASVEQQGLDYAQPSKTETATKGSGITPQNTNIFPSASKGSDKLVSNQGKSVKVSASEQQTTSYSIEPTTYINKKGETTPMHLVTFGRDLSKDEIRAGKELELEDDVVYTMGDSPESFKVRQRKAVENKGTVMPGLNDAQVKVVDVPKHDFLGTGKQALNLAESWAKKNIVGVHKYTNNGITFNYEISNKSIGKYLSATSIKNSDNLGVHLAVLKKLPDVISSSIEIEEHPDYSKNDKGVRNLKNPIKDTDLIHRFYGAVTIDGIMFRAKTTMKEYRNVVYVPRAYNYEITKIELIKAPFTDVSSISNLMAMTSTNSISLAKLLQNVEKSYDKGKKLLDASKLADEDTSLYRESNETGDVWKDESLGIDERITMAAARLAMNHKESARYKDDAVRAINANLTSLNKAMSLQKKFDKETVKRVYDLARVLIQTGYINNMSQGEMLRLLAAVKNSVGKDTIEGDVQKILDIMIDNQLKNVENILHSIETIKGSKVDARGVEIQGQLVPDGVRVMRTFSKARGSQKGRYFKTNVRCSRKDRQ